MSLKSSSSSTLESASASPLLLLPFFDLGKSNVSKSGSQSSSPSSSPSMSSSSSSSSSLPFFAGFFGASSSSSSSSYSFLGLDERPFACATKVSNKVWEVVSSTVITAIKKI